MDVETEELPLVVEVVIDAEEIFAHGDGQVPSGRGVGAVALVDAGRFLVALNISALASSRLAGILVLNRQSFGRRLKARPRR